MARTKSTDETEGATREYTRRTPAERAQLELEKANARVEKAGKRVGKAVAELDAAQKELSRAERFREYAASSPDLPETDAVSDGDVAQFSDEPQGEPVESAV